jgi:hypothetical protein
MTCQCDCPHVRLANRRCFIAGLACTTILPMAANAQLAGPPTAEDVTFMRMAIEEARLADFPFGAVIVRDGAVMARGRKREASASVEGRELAGTLILPTTEAEAWGYSLEIDQRAPNDPGSILSL